MVNNESDSESECFESAEESLEEEEEEKKLERKTRSKRNSRESESEIAEPVVSENDKENETVFVEDISVNLSYRKRPERVKRTPSIPSQKINSKVKRPSDAVFKTDVADVFFQDITSNLSKNINKSLHSLQQTSCNVKDLILSSLPSPSSCEEGFVYDESLDILPPPVDNKDLSDEIFDDKTIFNESPKVEPVQNHEVDDEMFEFKKECLEIKSGNNPLDGNSTPVSDSETKNLESNRINKCESKLETTTNKKKEKIKNSKECCLEDQISKASDVNNESNYEDQVNKDCFGQSAVNISSQSNVKIKKPDPDKPELENTENKESNLSNKIVPPSVTAQVDNIGATTSLQIQNSSDSLISEEMYLKLSNKEKKLDVDCQNTSLQNIDNITEDLKTDKNNEGYCHSKVDYNQTQGQKRSDDLKVKVNAVELKTDNEIIMKQEEVNDKNETLELGTPETNFNVKESSETSNGWDDFDFSDNEFEGVNTEDANKCAKLDESKDKKDVKQKQETLGEAVNFISDKSDMNFKDQMIPNAVSLKKYLKEGSAIDEGIKGKDTSENEKFDEDWEWENWDDETDQKEREPSHMTTIKNYDKTGNISDDGVKWSGWDSFSQRIEEKQGNWNLGAWGVNLLLNKATAVTQGISNVLEAGLGAPDPETLAKMQKEEERKVIEEMEKTGTDEQAQEILKKNSLTGVSLFPVTGITNLVAGVTSKIVEHTKIQEIGSKVLTGGLDTLETFGKKTMEVLQDGDPGLRNKRALLTGNNKPVLSQILKEAREKADKEIKQAEEKALAKKCHFETLFDDFQGMVHLEALEMLSRQYEIKLDQLKNGMSSEELEDLEGVLEEVEQLCALDDLDINTVLDFKTSLQLAVEPLKEEISVEKIIQIYDNANKWLETASELDPSDTSLHQKAVSTVAELTAATVHQFLKAGELLSIKECRKTVDEVDALAKLTNILCMEINKVCERFISVAQMKTKKGLVSADSISEKVIVMRNNSISYIKQAFDLLIPVLQAGAAL